MKTFLHLCRLYDELCKQADGLLKKYNPCSVKCGHCIETQLRPRADGSSFCCSGCKYLGQNGCTVQALTCKLWLCHTAYARLKEDEELAFETLKIQASVFWTNRGNKRDHIRNALRNSSI